MPVKKTNERLIKMKPKNRLDLTPSKLRKIIIKSERETGFKTIRARPVWSEEKQDAFLNVKIERKIVQGVTGRVMDIMKMNDTATRKKLHLETQKFLSSQRSKLDKKRFVKNIMNLLGKTNGQKFIQLFEDGTNINFEIIGY